MPGQSVRRKVILIRQLRNLFRQIVLKTWKKTLKPTKTKNCLDIMSDQNQKCPDIGHFCFENVRCLTVISSSGYISVNFSHV